MAVSTLGRKRPMTVPAIAARKGGEPIVCLTAYSTPMARCLDAHVDLLLVGDSLGMVLYGMENTLGVTVEMMINHGRAVVRGRENACVIVDLPFGSYQASTFEAYRTAARVMAETGCDGVKLEGGVEMAETVAFLTARGIPVFGHVGLMPQSVKSMGGYKVRGKNAPDSDQVLRDAKAIAEAGAFAIVVECTVETLARELTDELPIPTIGIGASAYCDGQILVTDDVLGLFTEFTPKFVKRYADLGSRIEEAAEAYAADVKARRFPGNEHCFGLAQGPKRASG
ncbi:MAG: 3-methyl-2-oxobutanoate hydroxymethyltransferase [Proteobacteria bacterium]|nr:3-methyl-2-oxobutanoate hydroxymethyltransferase [Pseudomonadota bacterium]